MRNKLVIFSVSLLAVAAAYAVFAGGDFSSPVTIEHADNVTVNVPTNNVGGSVSDGEEMLSGSIVESLTTAATSTTATSDLIPNFVDRIRYGNDLLGWRDEKTKILSWQNSTNTVFIMQNKEGRRIWINKRQLALRITGAPPVETKFILGTSTRAYVPYNGTDKAIIAETTVNANSSFAALMFTGAMTSANAPTSSAVFYQPDYSGTAGLNWVYLEPGEYLLGYATSSVTDITDVGAVTSTSRLINAKLFVPYQYYQGY